MIVHEGLEGIIEPLSPSSVAVGVFDGVHLGHRAIIERAVADARANGRQAVVFTFDRHPEEVVAPDRAPEYLTTPAQRDALIAELDVDVLVLARFDLAFSQLTPDQFLDDILKRRLRAEAIVVGADFRFGRKRAGDVAYLAARQSVDRFTLYSLDAIEVDGAPVSSTRIRELLRDGDPAAAEWLLGHPYWLAGTVVHGQKLGRTLGYPTANLKPDFRQAVPGDGVYAVLVRSDVNALTIYGGACSIGYRPTIPGAGRAIETYLLDFQGDLYGWEIELRFLRRLRPEEKYGSVEKLVEQIGRDVAGARAAVDAELGRDAPS